MMALPGCSTTPRAPTIIDLPKEEKAPPAEAMQKCENLGRWTDYITREEFEALLGGGQLNAIIEYAVEKYAGPYHECAVRHNKLVEYEEERQ